MDGAAGTQGNAVLAVAAGGEHALLPPYSATRWAPCWGLFGSIRGTARTGGRSPVGAPARVKEGQPYSPCRSVLRCWFPIRRNLRGGLLAVRDLLLPYTTPRRPVWSPGAREPQCEPPRAGRARGAMEAPAKRVWDAPLILSSLRMAAFTWTGYLSAATCHRALFPSTTVTAAVLRSAAVIR